MARRIGIIVVLMVWVVVGFFVAEFGVSYALLGLQHLGVTFSGISSATLNTIFAALVYIVSLVLVIGLPWWVMKRTSSRTELGIQRFIKWSDPMYAVCGVFIYLVLSALFAFAAAHFSGFPSTQAQDVAFQNLSLRYEYFLAFVTLVVIAPLAEELLFRGYLYGKIRKRAPFWITMLLVSLVFASLHLPGVNTDGSIQWQWNVALDVFALSLVLTSLREYTGSIWAGVCLHAIKNGIAFYFLFIMPLQSIM